MDGTEHDSAVFLTAKEASPRGEWRIPKDSGALWLSDQWNGERDRWYADEGA